MGSQRVFAVLAQLPGCFAGYLGDAQCAGLCLGTEVEVVRALGQGVVVGHETDELFKGCCHGVLNYEL